MASTLSPAQNKQCLFYKPRVQSSLHRQQGRTCQGSHQACHCGTGTDRDRRHWGLGGGQWDRPCPRCHCTETFLGNSPSGAQRGGKSEAHKGSRQRAFRRRRHLGAAAKSAGEAPGSPRPLGLALAQAERSSVVEISILAAALVAVPGGGAEAGTIPRAAGRKGWGWDNPRVGSGGQPPPPGPALPSRVSRALGQRQELLLAQHKHCRRV